MKKHTHILTARKW